MPVIMLDHMALTHVQLLHATCRAGDKMAIVWIMAAQPSASSPSILERLQAPDWSDMAQK